MYDHDSHFTDEETKARHGLSIWPEAAQLASDRAEILVRQPSLRAYVLTVALTQDTNCLNEGVPFGFTSHPQTWQEFRE